MSLEIFRLENIKAKLVGGDTAGAIQIIDAALAKQPPECTCKQCGFVWQARKLNPAYCPLCQSRKWNLVPKPFVPTNPEERKVYDTLGQVFSRQQWEAFRDSGELHWKQEELRLAGKI